MRVACIHLHSIIFILRPCALYRVFGGSPLLALRLLFQTPALVPTTLLLQLLIR